MKEDSMLMCLIAFVLGYLVARMMRGNGLMVGGQANKCDFHKGKWIDSCINEEINTECDVKANEKKQECVKESMDSMDSEKMKEQCNKKMKDVKIEKMCEILDPFDDCLDSSQRLIKSIGNDKNKYFCTPNKS